MPSGTPAPACERPGGAAEVVAVVPCYNVGEACAPVLEELKRRFPHVLAVDDGSTDGTAEVLARSGAPVLTHPGNLGKGAALLTAFRWALERGFGGVLTLDGDGQHDPADAPALLRPFWSSKADLVIGVRNLRWGTTPFRNWLGNAVSGHVFAFLTRTGIRDCQSGYRLYSARLLECLLPGLRPGRYETEMELLLRASRGRFSLAPVPIRTIYDEQSRRLSHFAPCRDSLRIAACVGRDVCRRDLACAG